MSNYTQTYLRMVEHEKYFNSPDHHMDIFMEQYKYYIDEEYDTIECYVYNSPLYIFLFALYSPIKLLTHGLVKLYFDWKKILKPTAKMVYYRNPEYKPQIEDEDNEESL
ncbi:MAG: hypothetical protein RSC93_01625 [Erysipelotrichaceae bacterium]